MMNKNLTKALGASLLTLMANSVWARCSDIPRNTLASAITAAAGQATGGYGLPMWVSMVDETGRVCHVASSGNTGEFVGNSQWLGSRVISAQKANTANAFSLDGYAISTANLYSAVQPGGSLYGLQHSNPVDADKAYQGSPKAYGTAHDPLVNKRIGGVNVFGGGLALYKNGKKIGAIGVSGDTSCRDHAFAWRVRSALEMHPTVGITTSNMNANGAPQTLALAEKGDEMILGPSGTSYWNAWSHPACPNSLGAATTDNGTIDLND